MENKKFNTEADNTENTIKHDDKNLNVSGGYRGFFPRWHIRELRCDNCDKVIDNETTHCLTTTEGRHICENCLNNYKKLMSQAVYDDYVRQLLGLNTPKRSFGIRLNPNKK